MRPRQRRIFPVVRAAVSGLAAVPNLDGTISLSWIDATRVTAPYAITRNGTSVGSVAQGVRAFVDTPVVRAPDLDMNFSQYANVAALFADTTVWDLSNRDYGADNPLTVSAIDTAVTDPAVASDRTFRYDYQNVTGADSLTRKNRLPFPSAVKQVWAEFRMKWSPNFSTWSGIANDPGDHKLIFGDTMAGDNGRWSLFVGSGAPPALLKYEHPFPFPSGNRVLFGANNVPSTVPLASYLWDGTWHAIRFNLKASTTNSSNDGRIRIWIDGTLYHEETGFSIGAGALGTGAADAITGFSFAHNKDKGPAGVLMNIWWSRIRFWYTNPGWR